MKRIVLSLMVLLTIVQLFLSFSAQAEQKEFVPPKLGAPTTRHGSGSRDPLAEPLSNTAIAPNIQLLATKRTGLSSAPTPVLYWYTPTTLLPYTVEITVQQEENPPLLKRNIGTVKSTGIQSIRLADYGIKLVNGQDYTWSVAIIANTNPYPIKSSSAVIRYQTPTTPLIDIAKMLDEGYWYDAITQSIAIKSPQLSKILSQEGIAINTN